MPDHPLSSRAFLAACGIADDGTADPGTARRMVLTAQRNAAWRTEDRLRERLSEAALRESETARLERLLRRVAMVAAVVIAAVAALWGNI